MREYEIRILKGDSEPSLTLEVVDLSDRGAIRQARKMAEGRPFEVWRDLDRIYSPPPVQRY